MNKLSSQFLYTSSAKASLFDIVAEDSLKSSLKPAWEYFCKVLQTKYPVKVGKLLEYPDELFYIFLFVLEEYNLRRKSASITESFYELTRESTAEKYSFLLRKAKWLSVISVAVLPYILEKLRKHYENVKEKVLCNEEDVTSLNKKFYEIYPLLMTIAKWIRILNYVLYLFNYTSYASPLLYITRIQLKYASKDVKSLGRVNNDKSRIFRVLNYFTDTLASIASKLTPLLFYSLQFVDTFYQQDTSMQNTVANLTVTDPPNIPKVLSSEIKLPPSGKQCPLCRGMHVNPTSTSISGFVFCYTCIHKYIERFGCCPVTYRPCDLADLIQLHP